MNHNQIIGTIFGSFLIGIWPVFAPWYKRMWREHRWRTVLGTYLILGFPLGLPPMTGAWIWFYYNFLA